MILIKSNQGKIDQLSRRLSQILSTHENLWEGIQTEKLKQRITDNTEKGNKTTDVIKDGSFITVKELEHTLHRKPEL